MPHTDSGTALWKKCDVGMMARIEATIRQLVPYFRSIFFSYPSWVQPCFYPPCYQTWPASLTFWVYIYLFIKIAKSLVPPGEFTKIQRAIRNSQMLQPLDSDGKMDESGVFSRSNSMESYGKTMEKPWEHGDLYGKSPFLMGKSGISMSLDWFKGTFL